eukprot:SAG31_NODE_3279_length_4470_cov_48.789293_2_plen_104_part_00
MVFRKVVTVDAFPLKLRKTVLNTCWDFCMAATDSPVMVDSRSIWMLGPAVAEALPYEWMRAGYDRWRMTVRDGGRLIDRLNANELEVLSEEEKAEARKPAAGK